MSAAIARHAADRVEAQGLLPRFVGASVGGLCGLLLNGAVVWRCCCSYFCRRHAARAHTRPPLPPATCAESIVKASRDPSADVKAAAARATGRLLLAQAAAGGGAPPPSLPPLLSTAVALLGMDQDSEVQRTMMSVLRRLAVACPAALPPVWKDLVPSICAIVQVSWPPLRPCCRVRRAPARLRIMQRQPTPAPPPCVLAQGSAGPTKVAAERTLARVMSLDKAGGVEAAQGWVPQGGPLARTIMQEPFLRRLSKMPVEEDDDGLLGR